MYFMCALNNKIIWRPIQPMLNNYTWTSGPEPRGPGGVEQPGSDTNISTVSHNFQQCCASHFDAVGCQNFYCQFKYMYVYLMINVYKR